MEEATCACLAGLVADGVLEYQKAVTHRFEIVMVGALHGPKNAPAGGPIPAWPTVAGSRLLADELRRAPGVGVGQLRVGVAGLLHDEGPGAAALRSADPPG